jgi:hypothetical protein
MVSSHDGQLPLQQPAQPPADVQMHVQREFHRSNAAHQALDEVGAGGLALLGSLRVGSSRADKQLRPRRSNVPAAGRHM